LIKCKKKSDESPLDFFCNSQNLEKINPSIGKSSISAQPLSAKVGNPEQWERNPGSKSRLENL
jgi:Na+-transporting methylmalonyl-CoA/oxaloacetate decarboxylase beta subunit